MTSARASGGSIVSNDWSQHLSNDAVWVISKISLSTYNHITSVYICLELTMLNYNMSKIGLCVSEWGFSDVDK